MVVGCDGLIGSALTQHLEALPAAVYTTSRRADLRQGGFALDLADLGRYPDTVSGLERLAEGGSLTVFMVAAVTDHYRCERAAVLSRRVNVTNTALLAKRLLAHGAWIVFLSSSAVFSDEDAATEESLSGPKSEYGRQKADAEVQLVESGRLAAGEAGVAVVRLTKVLAPAQSLMRGWIEALRRGEVIEAATDLACSPISLQYVVHGLVRIGARRQAGVFHLSGARSVAYYEVAVRLARALGLDEERVRPITIRSRLKGASLAGAALLRMELTSQLVGMVPQPLDDVICDLLTT